MLSFGISAIESDPIIVDGIDISGKTIPILMPSIVRACSLEYPPFISISGSIIDTNGLIRLPTVLIVVSGADELNKVLKVLG